MNKSFIIPKPRLAVSSMQPYQSGVPIEQAQRELGIKKFIKLASNENPRGPSKNVLDAVRSASSNINRYPDSNGYELKNILADRHAVDTNSITLGCGSNEILELIASAYLDSDSSAIYSQYAFLVYALAIQRCGAEHIVVEASDFAHDLDAMRKSIQANTKVVYLANPNNPTGTYIEKTVLINFLNNIPSSIIVVLDEAYSDYISLKDYPDGISLLNQYPNLVVTKSFSKAYGLGGLRIGYSVSSPDVADILNRVRPPFNVSSISLEAAKASFLDEEYIKDTVTLNTSGMQQMCNTFNELDIKFISSVANFISFKSPYDTVSLNKDLLNKGFILRPISNYGMSDFLRVSIGLESENEEFLSAFKKLVITHRDRG